MPLHYGTFANHPAITPTDIKLNIVLLQRRTCIGLFVCA